MQIKKIEIRNFKSFKKLSLELGKLNILIGPNGAGKSNFLEIFKFIRDIIKFGLENAISMQGEEYLRNINLLSEKEELYFKIVILPDDGRPLRLKTQAELVEFKLKEFEYEFSLGFPRAEGAYKVGIDRLSQKFDLFRIEEKGGRIEKSLNLGGGSLNIVNESGQTTFNLQAPIKVDDLFRSFMIDFENSIKYGASPKKLLLENQLFFMPLLVNAGRIISNISIYDFEPKLPKQATSIAGKAELEENGENLAIVLRKLLADEEKKRMLFNLIQDALPFIENIQVEKFIDKYLQIMIKESYSGDQFLPAFLMSEGTIFIIDLILALYFEKKPLTILEEPERRIHPYLISKMVDMMNDASANKQIIISTHNPEVVKHADIENIYMVSREEGYSTITKPHEKEQVKAFLENEIGLEELFIQNILGL